MLNRLEVGVNTQGQKVDHDLKTFDITAYIQSIMIRVSS